MTSNGDKVRNHRGADSDLTYERRVTVNGEGGSRTSLPPALLKLLGVVNGQLVIIKGEKTNSLALGEYQIVIRKWTPPERTPMEKERDF